MYFDFIAFFIKIYDTNQGLLTKRKNQYQQSQKVIEETEDQIEKTKNKIKKLQPTIIMI
jgi:ABC-type Fe3+-hydroxamate transport system substrate-binding protein